MNKKRILLVTSEFPPQPGGIGNHAYYLALYLTKKDFNVTVVADQRDSENASEIAFDAALPFAVTRIAIKRFRFLMYFNRVVKTLSGFKKADTIIATGKFSLWAVAACSLLYKRQTLAVLHGTEVNFKSLMLRKSINLALKQFNKITAVSRYTRQLVAHLEKEVTVIPNGIDLNAWPQTKEATNSLHGFPIITTVGRVSERKGQKQIIKILPELLKQYPNAQYHCVGIPTEAPQLQELAANLGVANHVKFHGALTHTNLKHVLGATNIFAMLSVESTSGDIEGFGIAILEANAMGIPAIGSRNCGIEDAISNGYSGFLVSSNHGQEFCVAVAQILSKEAAFKQQARHWAEQHDWQQIIKKYVALIS
ncbi:glycosyltransferase family 4 protein [Bizionia sediminis]|uniref:Glycosyltransferase family 4 protein n=1 Tax=Bizionia sediminis TaxID=1737064 RepID=A0ABW5KN42_9FLAO